MRRLLCFVLCFFIGVAHATPQQMSCLVADVDSGYIFAKQNIHTQMPPASLAKVMTLYLTFTALDNGWLGLDNPLPISNWAASQEPSNLELIPGDTITVREAILALIVKSANDVAVVLAESMAPSEADFARLMTQAAQQLGMNHTTFKNASGLHDPEQVTSAQDMAILTLAMIKNFPHYYPLFATQSFTYRGREYKTHNHVLQDYDGAEGLKTGYISAVGYNIISTAKKDNRRLVGIVIGGKSVLLRDQRVTSLLDQGFAKARQQERAVQKGLIQPAMDPLQRKAMVNKLNINTFAPIMQSQTRRALVAGQQLYQYNLQHHFHEQLHQVTFTQTPDYNWSIQIGAFNTQEKAFSMANKALSILKSPNYMVQTQRKNATTYRSRLTGFRTKQSAQTACNTLQNKRYACFVVAPQGDK